MPNIKSVTKSKRLRLLISWSLLRVPNAKLVTGGKHSALKIGAHKIPIASTPSGNEKRMVCNFKTQLKNLLIKLGLFTSEDLKVCMPRI
ncbi:hypothetical protein [Vibrio sp. PID23_8]|uniref:hypothetical protein n=1 Tax=Vibrio sp. PID23_8 TaxID=1583767 RepID=UPI000E681CD6|nr:hypothetical protein [Vibrio sp. PID23_8]RIZ55776.1 hypothetical protein AK966_04160 [Vibrio sp. PID23_8]